VSAVLVAGALCFEPLAEAVAGTHYRGASSVWLAEVIAGIAMATYFLVAGVAYRRRGESELAGPAAI
jgi:hypothetical protein